MLPIAFADPQHAYGIGDLISSLKLEIEVPGAQRKARPPLSRRAPQGLPAPKGDGERTGALTRLAGRMLAKGLDPEEVEDICVNWNTNNTPPLDEAKVRSTVASLAKTDARNHPERSEGQITPLFDPASAGVDRMLKTSPPPRRWLLNDVLPLGIVGLLVAPGGTGKSQFMLQLGVSVAAGVPLCELWNSGEQGTVVLLMAEDDMDEIHRRFERTVAELSPRHPNIAADLRTRLLIPSMSAYNNLMTQAGQNGVLTPTTYVDRLLASVSGISDLRLIVVDPASRFRGGNENSADDVTRFVEQLERIREATGATVLVCHHANKASMDERTGTRGQAVTRGSSAMTDGVRWQMNLKSVSQKDAKNKALDESQRYVQTELAKSNYGPPIDAEILLRKPGGYLTSINSSAAPVTLEDRILALLREEQQQDRTYSVNGFEKKFGGETGPLGSGKLKVREMINGLIAKGTLRKQGKNKHLIPLAARPLVAAP